MTQALPAVLEEFARIILNEVLIHKSTSSCKTSIISRTADDREGTLQLEDNL